MCPPFVVEEHDGAFWVHHQGSYNYETRQYEMGELAYNKPFKTRTDAQLKANELEMKTGVFW